MMLTRCPYCGTTFRVTPEQLKVRQGQVRCGKCRRIFDALRALVENAPPVTPPIPAPVAPVHAPEPEPPAAAALPVTPTATAEPAPSAAPSLPLQDDAPPEHHGLTWTIVQPAPLGTSTTMHEPAIPAGFAEVPQQPPDTLQSPEWGAAPSTDKLSPSGFAPLPDERAPAEDSAEEFEAAPEAAATVEIAEEAEVAPRPESETSITVEPEADATIEEITIDDLPGSPLDEHFVEEIDERGPPTVPQPDSESIAQARTEPDILIEPESAPEEAPTRMQNPRVDSLLAELSPPTILDLHEPAAKVSAGWPWVLGIILAALVIAAQLALHYRTDLVASNPELRPLFVSACEILGCRIELPHRIDMISIDSSDLAPDDKKPGTLYLTTTLRNRARFTQAWPDLEITLTDAQGRALLRRALAPTEYLAPEDSPGAGFPALSERVVQLTLSAPDVPAVGYRLYIFHP